MSKNERLISRELQLYTQNELLFLYSLGLSVDNLQLLNRVH